MPCIVYRVYDGATAACAVHRIVVAYTSERAIAAAREAGMVNAMEAEEVCFAEEDAVEQEDFNG